jgi:hypothetical protein
LGRVVLIEVFIFGRRKVSVTFGYLLLCNVACLYLCAAGRSDTIPCASPDSADHPAAPNTTNQATNNCCADKHGV